MVAINNSSNEHSIDAIEEAVWRIQPGSAGCTLEDIAISLGKLPEDAEAKEQLLSRIARAADSSRRFFYKKEKDRYFVKSDFFNGAVFVVIPEELEIEGGVLLPGDRFAPFCSENVFISEIDLMEENGSSELKRVDFECDIREIFSFHSLLGAETLYDFIVAEHHGNLAFLNGERNAKLTLTAFNMKKFYAKHAFTSGDAIVVTVEDYDNGIFNFSYLDGKKRNIAKRDLWIDKYSAALAEAIEDNVEYEEIPELLAEGFFRGGRELFSAEAASLDEFIQLSRTIELRPDDNGTILAVRNDDAGDECGDIDCECGDHHHQHTLPDGLSLSSGTVNSLEAILHETGSTLTMNELDAFIFDSFHASDYDTDALYRRLCGALKFADDAQEASFQIMFEERFEMLQDHYDRFGDENIAELRSNILELVEARLNFMDAVKDSGRDIPEKELKILAECSIFFNQLLALLHRPGYNPQDDDNYQQLLDTLDVMAEKQEETLQNISGEK